MLKEYYFGLGFTFGQTICIVCLVDGVGGQSVEFDCLTGDICARAVVIIFLYDFIFCLLNPRVVTSFL